jgi:ectoine hydroxylase-related dioxygenase (phytanoyl-CoA dioxygenase family)
MSQAAHAAAIDPADEIRERGYLVVPDFLSADELRALQSDIARLPDRLRSGPLPASVDVQWEKEAARSGELPQPLQLFNVHLLSERLDALMRSAKMRQVAEPFVGAQPAVFHTKYIAKAAHVGSEIPWHQDLSYWLGTVRSPYLVTCLIYLEDATRDNGCLEVVPGSHHRGLLAFQTRSDQAFRLTSKLAPAESSVHAIEAAAGTAVLFGPLMLHRSRANQSPRPRPSISIALTDGTAWNQQMGYLGTPPAVRRRTGRSRA